MAPIEAISPAAAGGTALVAPFIERGLAPLALAAFALQLGAVFCLIFLPKLKEAAA